MAAAAKPRPIRRLLLSAFFLALLLWLVGFLLFARYLQDMVPADKPQTEGIVVLTGDPARLVAGLELLATDGAERLLITGVHPDIRLEDLAAALPADPSLLRERVDLGRDATDTVGNAEETADWVRERQYHSLTVVTAGYHMPRSLVEFRRRMPEVELVPYPVFPEGVHLQNWWRWPGTTRLLLVEYHKYLASRLLNATGLRGTEADS